MPLYKINYTRPFLYHYQEAILNSPARYTVTEASTKVGKTASHIIWLFEEALKCKAGHSVWWIAPTIGQAKIAYERMKIQITNKDLFKTNEATRTITLVTGAKMEFKTASDPDNLYGDDVYAFVFDEFTRARENAWHALRSTVTATGGKGKFIGNVKGSKNWGHRLAMKCKNAAPDDQDWHGGYFKITAYDAARAGMMTKDGRPFLEEIEAAQRDLPENVFKELYLAEPTDDGANPFSLKFIKLCTMPLSEEPAICYGVDLAKSTDYTVELGLDRFGCTCYLERYQNDWRTTTARVKQLNKPITLDSTGVGDPIGEEVAEGRDDVELFKFTESSRQQLLEGLAVAIQQRKLTFPEGIITYELEQFEYVYTRSGVKYRAPDGEHDDTVMALALAWHKYKEAILYQNGPSVW
jgi:hypothetical protein